MNFSVVKNVLLLLSYFLSMIYILYGLIKPLDYNVDLGRHLIFGKIMFQSGEIIKTNLASYTNTNFEYINTHWLSEIIFYNLYDLFFPISLVVLVALCNFISILILFLFSYKRVSLGALAINLPLFAHFLIIRANARPEIFSYLFISIFIIILFKFREKNNLLIYILIPLMILWANLHIYFAVGLALVFFFLLEDLILKKGKINIHTKVLFVVLALSIFASFINPHFIKGAIYPALFFNNYGVEIQENFSFFVLIKLYNPLSYVVHIGLFISSITLLFLYRKKAFLIDWILLIVFSIAALLMFRNFYVFLLVCFYPFTKLFGYLINDLERLLRKNVNKIQLNILKALSYFFICLTIALAIYMQYTIKSINVPGFERGEKAVQFYMENNLDGPIYNSFDLGQYLIYKLYPEEKVYVDARPEAYPADFLENNYNKSLYDYQLFKEEDQRYKFNTLFILPSYYEESTLLENLINDKNFKLVYLDSQVLIFVKNNTLNRKVINKYEITKDSFSLKGSESPYDLLGFVLLFDVVDWIDAEMIAYDELSKLENGICSLHVTLNRRATSNQSLKNIPHIPDDNCF